ncbi:MAG: cation:proton antiporter [bacterium]
MTIALNELFDLGAAILLGLLAGKFAHRVKIPRVTGYLLVGLLLGPSSTGMITGSMVENLSVINDVALGLILFAIGNEFEWSHLKRVGIRALLRLAIYETVCVFVVVAGGFLLLGHDLVFSMLAGTAAVATAPAATLLVVREYHTRGPLTDRLLALVAVNNLIALGLFRMIKGLMSMQAGTEPAIALLTPVYELVVSISLGYLLGKVLSAWESRLDELSELLLVTIGIILLGTGLGQMLHLSPMLVAMAAGATVANSSYLHRLIYVEQRQLEQPLYIAFFVLAGSTLHLDILPKMGIAGLVYLIGRTVGKMGGVWLAGRRYRSQIPMLSRYLGMTLLCQAGVAIGIAYEVQHEFPEAGILLTTVVLATVVVNETVGPFLVRLGLDLAGEIPPETEIHELEGVDLAGPEGEGSS